MRCDFFLQLIFTLNLNPCKQKATFNIRHCIECTQNRAAYLPSLRQHWHTFIHTYACGYSIQRVQILKQANLLSLNMVRISYHIRYLILCIHIIIYNYIIQYILYEYILCFLRCILQKVGSLPVIEVSRWYREHENPAFRATTQMWIQWEPKCKFTWEALLQRSATTTS